MPKNKLTESHYSGKGKNRPGGGNSKQEGRAVSVEVNISQEIT